MTKVRVWIIGGGAAGMMVAAILALSKKEIEVHIFEKNDKLGAKVLISGWWRCNVTTWIFQKKELLTKYTRGAEFLEYAFEQFGPKKVRKWFQENGVELKEEPDKRVFPVSNNGADVVWVFENIFEESNVKIHFKETVTSIRQQITDNRQQTTYEIITKNSEYEVDYVVLTTGWNAFAHTGSTWDWYNFARWLWHRVTQLWPSLNSFLTTQKWLHELSWISFEDSRVSFELSDWKKLSKSWSLLLTHFWISWPLAFIVASFSSFERIDNQSPFECFWSPIAWMDSTKWNEFLLDNMTKFPKKELHNILSQYFPKRFVLWLCASLKIDSTTKMSSLSKADRQLISTTLWVWIKLVLTARRPWDEFVTAWGVDTNQINNKTMESLVSPWLFFAWEIINADWVTGWFNLQLCWATGYLVANGIVEECD